MSLLRLTPSLVDLVATLQSRGGDDGRSWREPSPSCSAGAVAEGAATATSPRCNCRDLWVPSGEYHYYRSVLRLARMVKERQRRMRRRRRRPAFWGPGCGPWLSGGMPPDSDMVDQLGGSLVRPALLCSGTPQEEGIQPQRLASRTRMSNLPSVSLRFRDFNRETRYSSDTTGSSN